MRPRPRVQSEISGRNCYRRHKDWYAPYLLNTNISVVKNQTYDLLEVAKAALVSSGTATLETAIFKVPQLVCYRSSYISYQIAIRLVKLKYISLVNLILDKEIVTIFSGVIIL